MSRSWYLAPELTKLVTGGKDVLNFARYIDIRNRVVLAVSLVLQLLMTSNCLAGPPLVIDDPGILDPGAWEVILGISIEDRPACKITQAPSLDVSLGVSPNSQISFFLPRSVVNSDESERESGLGLASIGYKWRVISTPKWEWAVAANYNALISHDLYRKKSPDDIRILGLPLLVSHTNGNWTWNGQLGWNKVSDGIKYWDYGLALSHPLGDRTQIMVEVYGYAESSLDSNELNYQLGVDVEINPALHLLVSAGSRIKSGFEPENRLDYSIFVGLQWFSDSS